MTTALSPERAVAMQKRGMSYTDIGRRFGITPPQVSRWMAYMDYDPATYHLETIIARLDEGVGFYQALRECGISTSDKQRLRVAALLAERGIHPKRVAAVKIEREPDTRPRCLHCGILLEPYDPSDAEQRSWQNGTRDGLHCTHCESIIEKGGGRTNQTALLSSEDAEIELSKAFQYAD